MKFPYSKNSYYISLKLERESRVHPIEKLLGGRRVLKLTQTRNLETLILAHEYLQVGAQHHSLPLGVLLEPEPVHRL